MKQKEDIDANWDLFGLRCWKLIPNILRLKLFIKKNLESPWSQGETMLIALNNIHICLKNFLTYYLHGGSGGSH